MYYIAYQKLKSNPGNSTPGLDPETLDGISEDWITATVATSPRDKIVQEKEDSSQRAGVKGNLGEIGRISEHNIIGTPQGSVLSQILCNIYLHVVRRSYVGISTALRRAILKQNNAKVEPLTKQLAKVKHTQTNSDSVKRLYYCRYADDWIIGIRGTKRETEEIKTSVETYLREVLQLELSPTKTKITCLTKKKVLFLGANIVRSHHKRIMKCMRLVRDPKRGLTKKSIKQRVECTLRLEAPIARIRTKLRNAGFMSKGRPDPKKVWTVLEHKQIIDLYNAVFRGYINYYKFAANYGKMVSFL
ncbi:hypothetical protein ACTFIU_004078, partial [Dictyostelium citrinum]